jgi:hypothetical protein
LGNQKRVEDKLATMSLQLDEINTRLLESNEKPINLTVLKDEIMDERDPYSIAPITNVTEMEELDQKLSDRGERMNLKKQLTVLCRSSLGNGTTCAYKLIDALVSREFLCKCSWTGGSRGEQSKVIFKSFKAFLKFFAAMVHSWDSTFSMQDTEQFFKTILRNASKRCELKQMRASTKRNRKRKTPDYQSIADVSEIIENEDDIAIDIKEQVED